MSQDNVEIIRRLVEAWSAGDHDAARAAMHPEIEWYDPPEQLGQIVHRGHSGVDESMRNWIGAWDEWRYELDVIMDAGDDKVLGVGRQYGRGKGSQIEVASDLFHLWTVRDGKAVEMRMFMRRDDALKAAGLKG